MDDCDALIFLNAEIERQRGFFAPELIDLYKDAAITRSPSFEELDNSQTSMILRGPTTGHKARSLDRVRTLTSYVVHNLDIKIDATDEVRELLQSAPEVLTSQHGGGTRGWRGLTWLTPTCDLAGALSQSKQQSAADIARDSLGLAHVVDGDDLVRLSIPPGSFPETRVPTFFDGGYNEVFCLWSVPLPIPSGYAWDLRRSSKGLPEIVGPNITVTPVVRTQYLGQPSTPLSQFDRKRALAR